MSSMPCMSGAPRATATASVLLRIEDHDRQRSKPEYEAAILEDLAWLGFAHDGDARPPERARCDLPQGAAAVDRSRAGLRLHVHARGDSGIRDREIRDRESGRLVTRTPAATRSIPLSDDVGWRVHHGAGRRALLRRDARTAGAGSERAMRRSAGARSAGQLDVSVRGDRRRSPAAHHRRDSRRRSAAVDRPADSAGATARPRARRRASGITRW